MPPRAPPAQKQYRTFVRVLQTKPYVHLQTCEKQMVKEGLTVWKRTESQHSGVGSSIQATTRGSEKPSEISSSHFGYAVTVFP